EEQLNTLQRQLGAKVSSFRNKVTNVSPEHILSALKEQQAIVDFMVFKEIELKTNKYKTEQVIALLAVPNQGVQLIKLGALEPISQLIQSYRSAIEPNSYNDAWFTSNERKQTLEQTSKALYQKLWQPLVHALGNKQQVFLIPDGILHLLPFKALQDEQGQYLNQKIQITRLGSAREIVIPPLNNKTTTSTIFANPVYAAKSAELSTNAGKNRTVSRSLRGLEFGPLPGTKTESDSIQQTLQNMQQPVKLYSQLNATEMAIRQEKSPRILHIATHGFFLENIKAPEGTGKTGRVQFSESGKAGLTNVENPLARSGLALTYANQGILGINQADGSDGILTAMEVLNLQLEGTELVTLSACNTGVGEISVGEGVYSLNRAFQEAGAKAVLSTLWSISDEGTNHFMQKFYHRFLNNQPPQQALQETQDELKDSKKWQDPFFWAPFVMMGQ
ncbi:MAG: CHAT domain-containing protein, partial [Methylococcales bacterium]